MNKLVSETIYNQLGGSKFLMMTGAKNLTSQGNNLSFRLPKALKNKINMVKIELTNDDTYSVSFYKFQPTKFVFETINKLDGIQVSGLKQVFENHTGYLLSV